MQRTSDRNDNHNHEPDTNDAVTEDSNFDFDAEFRQQLDDDVESSVMLITPLLTTQTNPRPKKPGHDVQLEGSDDEPDSTLT